MRFHDIHRRFIAPHLTVHAASAPSDYWTVLHIGRTGEQGAVETAITALRRPSIPPLQLIHRDAAEKLDWSLISGIALVIISNGAVHAPWRLAAMGSDIPVIEIDADRPFGLWSSELVETAQDILTEPVLRRRKVRAQRAYLETLDERCFLDSWPDMLTHPPQAASHDGGWLIEGPFDSSFSLAIVNRALAIALHEQGADVGLGSYDAEGPRLPDARFLASEPTVDQLWQTGRHMLAPDIVSRNLWPPHVLDMKGVTRTLTNYAWEESEFPREHVVAFNATLNLITVTSHFVAKVLRDNGVHVPIMIVGNGIPRVPETADAERESNRAYRYLHISSCYPRKGADVLLEAWGQAFTQEDDVELVIKTHENAYNHVSSQIQALSAQAPHHAPIILIENDLTQGEIHQLYRSADAIICPTRGEGFGLPMAEAFEYGKPVITTGFSGQADFCTPETAWLCDFDFSRSRSHHRLAGSIWVEPRVGSLIEAMKAVRNASSPELSEKIANGRTLIDNNYRWDKVAQLSRQAMDLCERFEEAVLYKPKIGLLTSEYQEPSSGFLSCHRISDPRDGCLYTEMNSIFRSGISDSDIHNMEERIMDSGLDALLVSICAKSMDLNLLLPMLQRLETKGILIFLIWNEIPQGLDIATHLDALSQLSRLIVHSVESINVLKAHGLTSICTLIPRAETHPNNRRAEFSPESANADKALIEPAFYTRLLGAIRGIFLDIRFRPQVFTSRI